MSKSPLTSLMKTFFSEPDKRITLKEREILLKKDEFNDRLYLVLSGKMVGYTSLPDGEELLEFTAAANTFVGIFSFFSRKFHTATTIIAEEDTELAYIDYQQFENNPAAYYKLLEEMMPVVVNELVNRQQRIQEIALEREQALKKLIASEKLASLGQMAAGISHELNNSIAVLQRNTEWVCRQLEKILPQVYPDVAKYFQTGLQEGRVLSTRETREKSRKYQSALPLSRDTAERIVQTGISMKELRSLNSARPSIAEEIALLWEIGASFFDMKTAAQHAIHVVRSVKTLSGNQFKRLQGQDVNEGIRRALVLLRRQLEGVQVDVNLNRLPLLTVSQGELIQIWTNIIKNAAESVIRNTSDTPPVIEIVSAVEESNVVVRIRDNGPGISPKLLSRIFQPNVTTKVDGLAFGLGLGLCIVENLVKSYNGNIRVDSVPGNTVFEICLPIVKIRNYNYG